MMTSTMSNISAPALLLEAAGAKFGQAQSIPLIPIHKPFGR
jgi:hypothetical protein